MTDKELIRVLVDLLRAMEWQGDEHGDEPICLTCRATEPDGHDPDCALAQALTLAAEHPQD